MPKKVLFIILFFITPFISFTQVSKKDSLVQAEQILSETSRLNNFGEGITIDTFGIKDISQYNSLLLTDLISNLTGLSVKSYGLNAISTISVRGTDPSHTPILWNGLNIQNPVTGVSSLSAVPAFLLNEVSVMQGGTSSLYGSGAVGGAIELSSFGKLSEQNNVAFQAGYGSFNKQEILFSAKTGDSIYSFSLKIFKRSADNDFKFINTYKTDNPEETQTNAGSLNYGFLPELQVKTSQSSFLRISAFYQKYSKDMQTIMSLIQPNTENQVDENMILSANWRYLSEKFSLNISSGLINSKIMLTDQSIADAEDFPLSKIKGNSFVNEVEGIFNLSENQVLNAGMNITIEKGESLNFEEQVKRNRISLFGSYKISELIKNLNTAISIRNEIGSENYYPFALLFGADYNADSKISFKGNLSKNYKIPSLEELYRKSESYYEGNPDLKPESGLTGEFSIHEKLTAGDIYFELSQTVYNTSVKNWIIWELNDSGTSMPVNKEKGKSTGVEFRVDAFMKKGNSEFELNSLFSISNTTLSDSDEGDDFPMLYIPDERFFSSLNYSYKKFSMNFNLNYSGKRYYNHTESLDNYCIGNFSMNYLFPIKGHKLIAAFLINNVWNTEYQLTPLYAMPLRSYQLSLNIKINTLY